ncbi:MAG: DUF371 domain-containing protein [Candidatus Methanodesulfokora sp.]|jgi:hypothetical protein
MEFVVRFTGHENITARHKTTLEITKDENITRRADCIIGVRADKAVSYIPDWLKSHLLSGGMIEIELVVGGFSLEIHGLGSPDLILSSRREIVVRKSSYIDDRTIAIMADKAAADLPREIVDLLREDKFYEARIVPV